MNENKNKIPLSILVENLKNSIATSINTSGLPLYFVEYILKDITTEVSKVAKEQANLEKQNYERTKKEGEIHELHQDDMGE